MPKKVTTESFINKAKSIHGDKYDYSKVEYIKNSIPVCIICPEHGEFWQWPMAHLHGSECPICGEEKGRYKMKETKSKQVIENIRKKIHNKYDLSKAEYIDHLTPITLICNKHGEFSINPRNMKKIECPQCKNENLKAQLYSNFIEKAKEKHGDRFDYSKVDYKDNSTPVYIYDTQKKEYFWQTPASHLHGYGNPNEKMEHIKNKLKLSNDDWIKRFKQVHGDKYDYSLVDCVNNRTPITIICPEHGEFKQTPEKHATGQCCPKCRRKEQSVRQSMGKESFIERSKEIHGDKYDYSKVEYINNTTPVCIICPEHGEFWQPPVVHIEGYGCKDCGSISILENELKLFLKEQNIEAIPEKKFPWLKSKKPLRLDFYLPDYNIAIECQGSQHYTPYKHFGGEERLKYMQINDALKLKLCTEHGITILYYTKYRVNGENVFSNKNKLLEKIISTKSENEKV